MPQSLSYLLIHIIFSTKDRTPYLQDQESRSRLHAYLATIVRDDECECFCAGGVADHVHLAIRLSRTITVALPWGFAPGWDEARLWRLAAKRWFRTELMVVGGNLPQIWFYWRDSIL